MKKIMSRALCTAISFILLCSLLTGCFKPRNFEYNFEDYGIKMEHRSSLWDVYQFSLETSIMALPRRTSIDNVPLDDVMSVGEDGFVLAAVTADERVTSSRVDRYIGEFLESAGFDEIDPDDANSRRMVEKNDDFRLTYTFKDTKLRIVSSGRFNCTLVVVVQDDVPLLAFSALPTDADENYVDDIKTIMDSITVSEDYEDAEIDLDNNLLAQIGGLHTEDLPTVSSSADIPPSSSTPPANSPAPSSSAPAPPATPGNLSAELSSAQVQVLDTVFTLPAPMSELLAQGWAFSSSNAGITLDPLEEDTSFMHKGNMRFYITIYNPSNETKPIEDCYFAGVFHEISDENTGATVKLPGGIGINSTMDAVRAAYGEPDTESVSDEIRWAYKIPSQSLELTLFFNQHSALVDFRYYVMP